MIRERSQRTKYIQRQLDKKGLKILYFKYKIMANREFVQFQDIKFYKHPKYKKYLASKCGKILSLKQKEKRILKLHIRGNGYLGFQLFENNARKDYYIHRFVFETFNGFIPKGMVTDHIDNDKNNNQINNLQLLTPSENIRKNHFKKKVFSFNIETQEEKIFESITEAAEFHKIIDSSITLNCQKKIKTTKSKKDGKRYKFFYFKN